MKISSFEIVNTKFFALFQFGAKDTRHPPSKIILRQNGFNAVFTFKMYLIYIHTVLVTVNIISTIFLLFYNAVLILLLV